MIIRGINVGENWGVFGESNGRVSWRIFFSYLEGVICLWNGDFGEIGRMVSK